MSGETLVLLQGAWTTIWISGVTIMLGLPLGLLLGLARISGVPVLSHAAVLYISLGRAVPLVTLALFLFVGLPYLGVNVSATTAAILTLLLNTITFNAEIWRSAYNAFPTSQIEAASTVGMTRPMIFRRIMLPQMGISALPGLVNEATILIKTSPAIAVIGVVDLTRVTDRISARTYEPLPPILAAAVIYMIIIAGLVRVQRIVEARAARRAA